MESQANHVEDVGSECVNMSGHVVVLSSVLAVIFSGVVPAKLGIY